MATEYKAIFKQSEIQSSLKIRNVYKIRVIKEGFKNRSTVPNTTKNGCPTNLYYKNQAISTTKSVHLGSQPTAKT